LILPNRDAEPSTSSASITTTASAALAQQQQQQQVLQKRQARENLPKYYFPKQIDTPPSTPGKGSIRFATTTTTSALSHEESTATSQTTTTAAATSTSTTAAALSSSSSSSFVRKKQHYHSNLAMARSQQARPVFVPDQPLPDGGFRKPVERFVFDPQPQQTVYQQGRPVNINNIHNSYQHAYHHKKKPFSWTSWLASLTLVGMLLDTGWKEYRRCRLVVEQEEEHRRE
jgi:hypothetical protein